MRYTVETERQTLEILRRDPESHLRFPVEAYRYDGTIMTYRDNLGMTLHRRLYLQLVGQIPPGFYLRRTCAEPRCVNPRHFAQTRGSRGKLTQCRYGHAYTASNTLDHPKLRCRKCYEDALARRRTTTKRSGLCLQGHELTPENSYVETDKQDRVHRRCKTCHLAKMRERRANQKEES